MKSLRVQIVLIISVIAVLTGCSNGDPSSALTMKVDFDSIQMEQESFNKKETFTKFYVDLRNSGKETIYLDGKFWFEVVTVESQAKQRLIEGTNSLESSLIEAEEISFLSSNSWESVSEVFQAIDPYTESTFLVAVKLPVNTFLSSVKLYDARQTSELIDWVRLNFCPDAKGATGTNFGISKGEKCKDGKVVSLDDDF